MLPHTMCITLNNWTRMFEWDMARLIAKNGHQNDMCNNEIRLFAPNLDIILSSNQI